MHSVHASLRRGPALRLYACALAALAALATPALAQDRQVTLEMKGDAEQYARYQGRFTVRITFQGQSVAVEMDQVTRSTVKSVDENGNVTFELSTESLTQKVNGQDVPAEPSSSPTVVTQRKDGLLIAYKDDSEQDDGTALNQRLFLATTPIFSGDAVGVGSTWNYTFEPNSELGTQSATGKYTLSAFETVEGVDCAKIDVDYAEEAGQFKIAAKGSVWIEVASGDGVKSEWTIDNMPFPGPTGQPIAAKGESTSSRLGGSPVAGQGGDPDAEAKPKTIDEVVKGYEKIDGLFPIYRKMESGRENLYMELNKSQLDQWVMMQVTAGTGDSQRLVAGDPIADLLFKFSIVKPEHVTMVVPNELFRAAKGTDIAAAVERSFADSYLEQYKIEAEEGDRLLISVSDLFVGDLSQISVTFGGGGGGLAGLFGGGASYSPDRDKTFISKLENFPENLYVETTFAFSGGGGGGGLEALLGGGAQVLPDSRSVVVKAITNLYMLPDTGYEPRKFDARVGYFNVGYQDFTNDRAIDMRKSYILRWNLVKQDPDAEISDPVKPITFWMDYAIPQEYRESVRLALLEWNKAFETAGFSNAVVVKQMEPGQFSMGDMRYNVVRWVASPGSAYAVALFRPNPLTGEILNASITVDSNITRAFASEGQTIVKPSEALAKLQEHAKEHGHDAFHRCNLMEFGALQAAFGMIAADAMGSSYDEEKYVQEFIRWVVKHEFGHILGLRHNFVASTELDMAQLGDPKLVGEAATSASVMDYVPFNPSALRKEDVPFWAPNLGKYDFWAIQYGYTPGLSTNDLRAIASRTNEPGLAYQSDEVADSIDPYVGRFDLSARPLEYWERMIQLSRNLLVSLDKRVPQRGKSYWEMTRDFNVLVDMMENSAFNATRYLGGIRLRGNFAGDPGQQPTLTSIDRESQFKALGLLNQYVFGERSFEFPKRIYQYFAPNPNADMMQAFLMGPNDHPVMSRFASIQSSVLSNVLSPGTLTRVQNNEFKATTPGSQLTLATLMRSVTDSVWSELGHGGGISTLRRSLQNDHLRLLAQMALSDMGGPRDATTLAWSELRRLEKMLAGAEGKAKDEYTPAHLKETHAMVERILDAEMTMGTSGGGGGGSILDLLLGVEKKSK